MTRIGRVTVRFSENPDIPCFKLVVEGGRVVLGCWRFIMWKESYNGIAAVFERVS